MVGISMCIESCERWDPSLEFESAARKLLLSRTL